MVFNRGHNNCIITLGTRIEGGVKINGGVTKNEGFNASKTKKCIGRGLLKTPKLINVPPPVYSGPQSKHMTILNI